MDEIRRGAPFRRALVALALLGGMCLPGTGEAGQVIVFVSRPTPVENWSLGYGAALSASFFKFATLEGEAARNLTDSADSAMTSFTAGAFLSPPIKDFTPYGGVGVGLFRQTQRGDSDLGFIRVFVLGVKFNIEDLIVLKTEYRYFELTGEPFRRLEHRVSA